MTCPFFTHCIFVFFIIETGAVFIIGDSGLKNNQENYFFIKNDPVQKIFANYYGQNGVVCGRLEKLTEISFLKRISNRRKHKLSSVHRSSSSK